MAKILVVDDDAGIRRALRRILSGAGHDVVEASDGEGGVASFREHHCDLALVDVFMPRMTGAELMLVLRREAPEAKVLMVSGGGQFEASEVLRCFDGLSVQTLPKPFEPAEVLQAVNRALGTPAAESA